MGSESLDPKELSRYDHNPLEWNGDNLKQMLVVLANYKGLGVWSQAVVTGIHTDGTFQVCYLDGQIEDHVPQCRIAHPKSDPKASDYLSGSFEKFLQRGFDLVACKVDSDGSCLPHSISYALTGLEMFYDVFRAAIVLELTEHASWYRENLAEGDIYDDERWENYWTRIISSSQPTGGKRVGNEFYLESAHIFGLSNILRRPILLLDNHEEMECAPQEMYKCPGGIFLPLRHSRQEIIKHNNGRAPSMIAIAWQNHNHDHYVALALTKRSQATLNREFRAWQEEEFLQCGLQLPPGIGDVVTWCDPGRDSQSIAESDFLRLSSRIVSSTLKTALFNHDIMVNLTYFFVDNKPFYRAKSIHTLLTLLKTIDAIIDGRQSDRTKGTIKLDNPLVRNNILTLNHAKSLLLSIGFEETLVAVPSSATATLVFAGGGAGSGGGGNSGGGTGLSLDNPVSIAPPPQVQCLSFKFPPATDSIAKSQERNKLTAIIDCLEIMNGTSLKEKAFRGLHEISDIDRDIRPLLGHCPKLLTRRQREVIDTKLGTSDRSDAELLHTRHRLEWAEATRCYGEGDKGEGTFWSFGGGQNADTLVESFIAIASDTFRAVTGEDWSQGFDILRGKVGLRVVCPVCQLVNTLPANCEDVQTNLYFGGAFDSLYQCGNPICRHRLSLRQTKAAILERLVGDALKTAASCWICDMRKCL